MHGGNLTAISVKNEFRKLGNTMSSETILFNKSSTEEVALKHGNEHCAQALRFSLAATIILPIVGQIISVGQLIHNRQEFFAATMLGKLNFILALIINFLYVGGVLYLFANRPSGKPPGY